MAAESERLLVYGMQSSGATLVAVLLSQDHATLAVPDVFCGQVATPASVFPEDRRVVTKATVAADRTLGDHLCSFRPDRTVLVLRHPCQTVASLCRKPYASDGGPIDIKLARLEETFAARASFDAVVCYEDVVLQPAVAVDALRTIAPGLTLDAWTMRRHLDEIEGDARTVPALDETYITAWGGGNVSTTRIDPHRVFRPVSTRTRAVVEAACPELLRWYDDRYASRYPTWRRQTVASTPWRLLREVDHLVREPLETLRRAILRGR